MHAAHISSSFRCLVVTTAYLFDSAAEAAGSTFMYIILMAAALNQSMTTLAEAQLKGCGIYFEGTKATLRCRLCCGGCWRIRRACGACRTRWLRTSTCSCGPQAKRAAAYWPASSASWPSARRTWPTGRCSRSASALRPYGLELRVAQSGGDESGSASCLATEAAADEWRS